MADEIEFNNSRRLSSGEDWSLGASLTLPILITIGREQAEALALMRKMGLPLELDRDFSHSISLY
jgi:hypothetical protein